MQEQLQGSASYKAYQDQIFFGSGPEDKHLILLLRHQDLIQELNTEALWFVNGTFDVAPNIFVQLYTFCCKVGSSYLPCLSSTIPTSNNPIPEAAKNVLSVFGSHSLQYFPSILWVISLGGDFVPWVIFEWVILSFG